MSSKNNFDKKNNMFIDTELLKSIHDINKELSSILNISTMETIKSINNFFTNEINLHSESLNSMSNISKDLSLSLNKSFSEMVDSVHKITFRDLNLHSESLDAMASISKDLSLSLGKSFSETLNAATKNFNDSYLESFSMVNSSLLKAISSFNSILKSNPSTLSIPVLEDIIDYIPDISSVIDDVENSNNLSNDESELEGLRSHLNNINVTKFDYHTWIATVCAIISLIYTLVSFYQSKSYEDKLIEVLENVNTNLEKVIELNTTQSMIE